MSITHVLALDAYAIVLSWLTYRCVETPVRFSPTLTRSSGLTYAFAASSALTVTLELDPPASANGLATVRAVGVELD